MKVGTVSMAEVAKYGRMDASFHLAVQDIKADLPALESSMSPAQVMEFIYGQSDDQLQCLKPLLRGSKTGRKALVAAAQEYPHIAYALLKKAESPKA